MTRQQHFWIALIGLCISLASPALAQGSPPPAEIEKPANESATGTLKTLEPQPAIRLKRSASWEEGFNALRESFALLESEARKAGLVKAGAPTALFTESDDLGFRFEAYLPLIAAPNAAMPADSGLESAATPAGKVMVFPYEGSYEEIDSAYEAITAWLDEKGFVATGQFLEEYLHLPETATDTGMKLNIHVFLR
jgi:effector-binding domain-containing protein